MTSAPKSLRSFYGASDRPGERPQTIITPKSVLDMLPWEIALDPCACEGSLVVADKYYRIDLGQDGLILPWTDRTYCNPPYKDLKTWLAKAQQEACMGYRIAVLAPVRTHRKWFRLAMQTALVRWLDPVKFHGYPQAFPAPLCLLIWNYSY